MICTELGTPAPIARLDIRRIIHPKIMPMKPACFSGDCTPGAVGFESSGRTLVALRSGEAASISRHGALDPGTGCRLACCWIDAFNWSTASSVGGITEEVTR